MHAELVIVGAGPAGVSAALWARSRALNGLLLESGPEPGGQLHHIHFHPAEVAGVPSGDGPAIAATYGQQLRATGVPAHWDTTAVGLEFTPNDLERPIVTVADGRRFEADAVLIATGVRRRRLDVPGERELEGHGVSYSATRDRAQLRGKRVVVAGGGDAAFENALNLAAGGSVVTLVVRGTPRARPEFREPVSNHGRITVLEGTRVVGLSGGDRLRVVELEGRGSRFEQEADAIVVKVGVVPNTEWCRAALSRDHDGFVLVDTRLRTSRSRVWAAGDVARPALASIPVAMGQAALAIADIAVELRAT
jgi:thioredoxin reductase (NADPH)